MPFWIRSLTEETTNQEKLAAISLWVRPKMPVDAQFVYEVGGDLLTRSMVAGNAYCFRTMSMYLPVIKKFIEYSKKAGIADKGALAPYQTPLQYALLNETETGRETAKLLLAAGADPEYKEAALGRTPLWYAIRSGEPENLQLILNENVELNLLDNLGYTALAYAVADNTEKQHELVKMLIEAGADPNLTAPDTNPPLIFAADQHDIPLVEYMIEHGADPNIKDMHGLTMMDYGLIHKYQPLIDFCREHGIAAAKTEDPGSVTTDVSGTADEK